jgi:hypothetical protein
MSRHKIFTPDFQRSFGMQPIVFEASSVAVRLFDKCASFSMTNLGLEDHQLPFPILKFCLASRKTLFI